MQGRTKLLSEEILNLQSSMKEVKDLGHNKDEVIKVTDFTVVYRSNSCTKWL